MQIGMRRKIDQGNKIQKKKFSAKYNIIPLSLGIYEQLLGLIEINNSLNIKRKIYNKNEME